MAFEVRFTGTARRDLQNTPPRILPAIIEFAFGDLSRDPRRVGKPLQRELLGQFGARRGPYRLLYRIDDDTMVVHVLHVDYRADVYRTRWQRYGDVDFASPR